MNVYSKVVVITGASQNIGEGLVRGYLSRGYRVVANSRSIKPEAYEGAVLAVAGRKNLEENVAATGITLTSEDFERIDEAAPKGAASGERYEDMTGVNL